MLEVVLPLLEEAVDQNPEEAVAVVKPRALHAAPQDVELLAQDEVLEGETRAVRAERAHEQVEQQVHGGASSTMRIDASAAGAVASNA